MLVLKNILHLCSSDVFLVIIHLSVLRQIFSYVTSSKFNLKIFLANFLFVTNTINIDFTKLLKIFLSFCSFSFFLKTCLIMWHICECVCIQHLNRFKELDCLLVLTLQFSNYSLLVLGMQSACFKDDVLLLVND